MSLLQQHKSSYGVGSWEPENEYWSSWAQAAVEWKSFIGSSKSVQSCKAAINLSECIKLESLKPGSDSWALEPKWLRIEQKWLRIEPKWLRIEQKWLRIEIKWLRVWAKIATGLSQNGYGNTPKWLLERICDIYIYTYTTPVWTRCARPLGQPLEPRTPENVLWVIEQYLSIYIHESKQSSKYISKKPCEWKATHEAANGPDVLCLNELSGQTLSCHNHRSCITQNYATWNS